MQHQRPLRESLNVLEFDPFSYANVHSWPKAEICGAFIEVEFMPHRTLDGAPHLSCTR